MFMKIHAGYLVQSNCLKEWSEAQTDPLYVRCREEHCSVTTLTLLHYLQLKGWSKHIGVIVIPPPKDQPEGRFGNEWHTMFYRHEHDYEMPLRRFSAWDKYREQEADLKYKEIINKLGIEAFGDAPQWTMVAWVGRIGAFYDFSPQVVKEILERIAAAKAKRAEQAGQPGAVAPAPGMDSQ